MKGLYCKGSNELITAHRAAKVHENWNGATFAPRSSCDDCPNQARVAEARKIAWSTRPLSLQRASGALLLDLPVATMDRVATMCVG
jgi:hypothetical protein